MHISDDTSNVERDRPPTQPPMVYRYVLQGSAAVLRTSTYIVYTDNIYIYIHIYIYIYRERERERVIDNILISIYIYIYI